MYKMPCEYFTGYMVSIDSLPARLWHPYIDLQKCFANSLTSLVWYIYCCVVTEFNHVTTRCGSICLGRFIPWFHWGSFKNQCHFCIEIGGWTSLDFLRWDRNIQNIQTYITRISVLIVVTICHMDWIVSNNLFWNRLVNWLAPQIAFNFCILGPLICK